MNEQNGREEQGDTASEQLRKDHSLVLIDCSVLAVARTLSL